MPQMMPLYWYLMLFYTISLLMIIMSTIHFLMLPLPPSINKSLKKSYPNEWMWKW